MRRIPGPRDGGFRFDAVRSDAPHLRTVAADRGELALVRDGRCEDHGVAAEHRRAARHAGAVVAGRSGDDTAPAVGFADREPSLSSEHTLTVRPRQSAADPFFQRPNLRLGHRGLFLERPFQPVAHLAFGIEGRLKF